MLDFIMGEDEDKPVWSLDGYPISILIAGDRHYISGQNIRIVHIIEEPENPGDDRNTYIIKSQDGTTIDDIEICQTWERVTLGIKRYEGHSFPRAPVVHIPEDTSVVSCLAITLPTDNIHPGSERIPLSEYLARKEVK